MTSTVVPTGTMAPGVWLWVSTRPVPVTLPSSRSTASSRVAASCRSRPESGGVTTGGSESERLAVVAHWGSLYFHRAPRVGRSQWLHGSPGRASVPGGPQPFVGPTSGKHRMLARGRARRASGPGFLIPSSWATLATDTYRTGVRATGSPRSNARPESSARSGHRKLMEARAAKDLRALTPMQSCRQPR